MGATAALPSEARAAEAGKRRGGAATNGSLSLELMRKAWKTDFSSFSTNVLAPRAQAVGTSTWSQFDGKPCVKGVDM